jgi:hypothetical protein
MGDNQRANTYQRLSSQASIVSIAQMLRPGMLPEKPKSETTEIWGVRGNKDEYWRTMTRR